MWLWEQGAHLESSARNSSEALLDFMHQITVLQVTSDLFCEQGRLCPGFHRLASCFQDRWYSPSLWLWFPAGPVSYGHRRPERTSRISYPLWDGKKTNAGHSEARTEDYRSRFLINHSNHWSKTKVNCVMVNIFQFAAFSEWFMTVPHRRHFSFCFIFSDIFQRN